MSRHEVVVPLRHMLDAAREAAGLVRGRSFDDVLNDRLLTLGLVRLLEIVGEAAGRVPADFQAAHAAIPWPQVVGLRNRLIHGYDDVDLHIVWRILCDDIPPLIVELEKLLDNQ
jgi:uncharacterized protein with HEPN domain